MSVGARRLRTVAVGVLVLAGLTGTVRLMSRPFAREDGAPPVLHVYCDPVLHPAVHELARRFERRAGVQVELESDASARLVARLRETGRGDLLVPDDARHVAEASRNGLVAAQRDVGVLVPVLVALPGAARRVEAPADLARPGSRLAVADARGAAIARIAPAVLRAHGLADAVDAGPDAGLAVMAVPNPLRAVLHGHADAALVWEPETRPWAGRVAVIPFSSAEPFNLPVSAAVVTASEQPALAEAFLDFLAGPVGREVFLAFGYTLPGEPAP